MVGKNIDHPLRDIGWWKNKMYPNESTQRYQTGGTSTKIRATISILYFIFYILFLNKGKLVIYRLPFISDWSVKMRLSAAAAMSLTP